MDQAKYFHTDDTMARHDGTNYYAHVVCAWVVHHIIYSTK
jgi:hypothetical protein